MRFIGLNALEARYRAKRVDFLRYSILSSSRRRCGSGAGRGSGSGSCSGREHASEPRRILAAVSVGRDAHALFPDVAAQLKLQP